jgi:hypothetical protein
VQDGVTESVDLAVGDDGLVGKADELGAHSSDCEQRFRFKANAVPVETEQMPVGSTCGRCSVVKWPSWRPGHLTGYDIFARLFL